MGIRICLVCKYLTSNIPVLCVIFYMHVVLQSNICKKNNSKSSWIGAQDWATCAYKWTFGFSFGRWDSEQGKMHPMRKNIIMILADRKAQQYPLEQMEGVGRRTSILKCQALCSVSSHTSPHSSLTSAHELNAIPSHDVSTEETEAQRGSRTHSKFSMAKNPCFQFHG